MQATDECLKISFNTPAVAQAVIANHYFQEDAPSGVEGCAVTSAGYFSVQRTDDRLVMILMRALSIASLR